MSLAAVYEVDKRVARICRQMQVDGFGFDPERAATFCDMLRQAEVDAALKMDAVCNRTLKRTKTGGISTTDLLRAFFDELRAPVCFVSELSGKPSLGASALQAYAACHDVKLKALALAELERKRARKIRSTYIESIKVGSDGRVHPSWLNYGTVSGRWACQGPNLANLPRAVNDPTTPMGGIRSLYRAAPGCVLVGYDKSQIEFRIAAYGSGDEAMMQACEGADVHGANASAIFGAAFDAKEYKLIKGLKDAATDEQQRRFVQLDGLRTLAKSAVFAVCYLAEASTVYERILASGMGAKVTLRQVEAMLGAMRRRFAKYYEWQDTRLMACVRDGYTESPILGRRRWLGHDPSPPECANHPIQSGAADVMNAEIPAVLDACRKVTPNVKLVAHVYDAVYLEVPERFASSITQACLDVSLQPVTISSSGTPLDVVLPIDIKTSERWH